MAYFIGFKKRRSYFFFFFNSKILCSKAFQVEMIKNQEPIRSFLELNMELDDFWSRNMAELVEADFSYKATALFTMNSQSIRDIKFLGITEGSSLVFKHVSPKTNTNHSTASGF